MAQKQEEGLLKRQTQIVVNDPPKFDLDIYISNYEGLTRLSRLSLIGSTSRYLGQEAFHLAITEAQQGRNIQRYVDLVLELHSLYPTDPRGLVDQEWVDAKSRQIAAETERLENELKGYKNNLIKESIRMGNEDLGAFYYSTGDYPSAFKAYSRMRDYCTTPKHLCEQSLKLLVTAIAQQNWMQVQSNVYKIQGLQLQPADKARSEPVLAPMLALASLASSQYRDAAMHFTLADPVWLAPLEPAAGIHFNRAVLSGNDIAVYGALCALATMSRDELKRNVLDNTDFRNFLELEPHVRRAITCFCGSKYTQCLEILAAYRTDYLLDLYLQRHVEPLYSMIRRKCIIAYLAPFSRMGLDSMATAFNTSASSMTTELVDMIEEGVLEARVDLVDSVVVARKVDQRSIVHANALKMAATAERQLRLRLFRVNLLEAGLDIKGGAGRDGGGMGFSRAESMGKTGSGKRGLGGGGGYGGDGGGRGGGAGYGAAPGDVGHPGSTTERLRFSDV